MPGTFCSTNVARCSEGAAAAATATVDSPGTRRDGDGSRVRGKPTLLPILDDAEHALLDLEVLGLLQVDMSASSRSVHLLRLQRLGDCLECRIATRYQSLQWRTRAPFSDDLVVHVMRFYHDPAAIIFLLELKERSIVCG